MLRTAPSTQMLKCGYCMRVQATNKLSHCYSNTGGLSCPSKTTNITENRYYEKIRRIFFLDSNFTSKETKADKSLDIQQKLKVRDKVSPAEDCQGEYMNSVTTIQLVKSSRRRRIVRAEPAIIISLHPEQLFCLHLLEYWFSFLFTRLHSQNFLEPAPVHPLLVASFTPQWRTL